MFVPYAESHNGIDNIVVVLLQCLDSLIAADVGLSHDELNVLILESGSIDLLIVILLLIILLIVVVLVLLLLGGLSSLAGLAVVVAGVVLSVSGSELGSSSLLSGSVHVLDLGLTENTIRDVSDGSAAGKQCNLHVGVAVGRLVDLRVVDDEEDLEHIDCLVTHVLGSAESDTGDARNAGEVQLLKGLASLLLVAVVDYGRTSGELALADLLNLGLVAGLILVLLDRGLLGLLVGKFFNAGVRHFGDCLITHLCGGLDLGQSLALLESSLLLESEDLEAVEVGESLPSLHLVPLLGPVGLLPLGVNLGLLPELSDNTSSGTAVQALNNERGEENLAEGNGLSGKSEAVVRGRTVNENL
ncbi:hypothetical protein HG530_002492 [Fusarium avenaceum]|nr:hypothetical protein HG530_002492 [Fusarium avenaceum]